MGIHAAGLPTVELPRKDRVVSEFADELGCYLDGTEIFQRNRIAFILNDTRTALERISPGTLRTWIENHTLCFRYAHVGVGLPPAKKFETMSLDLARTLLESHQFLEWLPPVDLVHAVSLPVMRASKKIELLPKGYDAESRIFTSEGIIYATNMPLAEAVKILDDLLSEFPFADAGRSKSVQLAYMLTVFAHGLLPKKTVRPCFIIIANAEGAGKTLLGKIGVIVVLGRDTVQPLSGDEEEIRKRLLASVMAGDPVVFLDNLKGHLSSPSLEAFLTSDTWQDRVLGKSQSFSGEKLSTTVITGNGLGVSPDMRRRSLFVELFLQDLKAELRTLKRPLEVDDLFKMRPQILAALWAMVREWDKAGRPRPKNTHASFIKWSHVIGGILEFAGYQSPTLPPDLRNGGDTVTKDFEELAKHMGTPGEGSPADGKYDFMDVVRLCVSKGWFEFMLVDVKDPKTTGCYDIEVPPRTKSSFGKFLANRNGRMAGPGHFVVEGKGHARLFRVECIAPAEAPAPPPPADDSTTTSLS